MENLDTAEFFSRFPGVNNYWTLPEQKGEGVWSKPYIDKNADSAYMITYSEPIYKNGKLPDVDSLLESIDGELSIELENINFDKQLEKHYEKGLMIIKKNEIFIYLLNIVISVNFTHVHKFSE